MASELPFACTGTSDCDAGNVCCVASLSVSDSVCAPAPCAVVAPLPSPVQLCHGDGDCSNAGCMEQTCSYAGASLTVRSCGAIVACTVHATPDDAASD